VTGLHESQNEGNGLGLANTMAPRKTLQKSRGRLGSRQRRVHCRLNKRIIANSLTDK
jgi:hypothetical protein